MKRHWRLSRGQRTAVNLTLCALLLAGLWGMAGYPLPTAELELRRWERTCLMEPSRIAFSAGEGWSLEAQECYTELSRPLMVGIAENHAVVGVRFRGWSFSRVDLTDGPLVCLVPNMLSMAVFSDNGPSMGTPVLAFRVPEEAASAEITLLGRRGEQEIPLSGPGWRVGEGLWLFAADVDQPESSWSLSADAPCTLRLYRADGSLLLRWDGTLSPS